MYDGDEVEESDSKDSGDKEERVEDDKEEGGSSGGTFAFSGTGRSGLPDDNLCNFDDLRYDLDVFLPFNKLIQVLGG